MKLQELKQYFRDGQVSLVRKSLALFAILYGVMPLDAIPDVIPVVGWMDDVGVLGAVLAFIWRDVKKHAARSSREQSGEGLVELAARPPLDCSRDDRKLR